MPGRLTLQPDPNAIAAFRQKHERAFDRARQECIALADRNAPRGQGRLAASITADGPPRRNAAGVHGAFGSAERHAAMREFGGEIRPVRKRALSWIAPSGNRIVLGPGIRRKFAKEENGRVVIFVPGTGVRQRPGGRSQGYKPWLRPAGDRFPDFVADHLRAG